MAYLLQGKICWALPPVFRKVLQLTAEDSSSFLAHFSQASFPSLRASMELPDLWQEAAMLKRLLYKNNNQHRSSIFMRRLREVSRELKALQELLLPQLVEDLHAMTQLASDASTQGSGGRHAHRVPAREAAAFTMQRLQLGCTLIEGLVVHGLCAADQVAAQVAKSFFMPLGLTSLAMLARIQVLCSHLMLAGITAYNALADLLPLLPCAAAAGTPEAAQYKTTLRTLPSMLRCTWHNSLPRCVAMDDESSSVTRDHHHHSNSTPTLAAEVYQLPGASSNDWVGKRACQLWEDLGIMQGLEVVDLACKADRATAAASGQDLQNPKLQISRDEAQVRPAGPGDRQGKQAAATKAPLAPTALTAAATGSSLPQKSSTLKGLHAGSQDMGTKVDRQSFYDLIGSKSQQSQPRSSAAQPSAPLGIVDDRVARKRQKRQQQEEQQQQQQQGSNAGGRLMEEVEPTQGTVPVVYSTALSGFTLGLGGSKKGVQQQQQQQQQQQLQGAQEPQHKQKQGRQQHPQELSTSHAGSHSTPQTPQQQQQQQQQQQPQEPQDLCIAHSPTPPPQSQPQKQPPLPQQQQQQQQEKQSPSPAPLPALQQPQPPAPAFLRVGSVASQGQPKQGQPEQVQPQQGKLIPIGGGHQPKQGQPKQGRPHQGKLVPIGGGHQDVPAREALGAKRGMEDAQGSAPEALPQPQLSLLDALSNKKRKKAKQQPPVEGKVEKPKAWDDLLPANLPQGSQAGKNKKKKNK